ncbi:unnamed protein product, partial [Dovyalis caffra]
METDSRGLVLFDVGVPKFQRCKVQGASVTAAGAPRQLMKDGITRKGKTLFLPITSTSLTIFITRASKLKGRFASAHFQASCVS